MKTPIRLLLVASLAVCLSLLFDGLQGQPQSASAQGFSRGRDGDGESREERRERWRRSFGEGGPGGGPGGPGGGRGDLRGRGSDGDRGGERGGDFRSSGSGSSGSSDRGSSGSSSGSSDSRSTGGSSTSLSTMDWAKKLVEERDKNGNHWLDGDELKGLGGPAAKADLNNDGIITVDELVQHSSAAAAGTTSASTATSATSSSGGDSSRREGDRRRGDAEGSQRVFVGSVGGPNSKEADKRRTWRFSTAADRLPKSLPSFFSRDTNGDGQISMNEYSRTWSKSTVAEFRKYDLNDDGIITAKEATQPSTGG